MVFSLIYIWFTLVCFQVKLSTQQWSILWSLTLLVRLYFNLSYNAVLQQGLRIQKFPVVSSSCKKTSCLVHASQGQLCSDNDLHVMCAYHSLVCWCGRSQQVGLLFQPTSVALNIEISAEQDSHVSTVKIFKLLCPNKWEWAYAETR